MLKHEVILDSSTALRIWVEEGASAETQGVCPSHFQISPLLALFCPCYQLSITTYAWRVEKKLMESFQFF